MLFFFSSFLFFLFSLFDWPQVVAAVLSLASDEFLRWIIEQDLREVVKHVPYPGSTRALETALHHLHCDGLAPAPVFTWLARTQAFRWEMHLKRVDITARYRRKEHRHWCFGEDK